MYGHGAAIAIQEFTDNSSLDPNNVGHVLKMNCHKFKVFTLVILSSFSASIAPSFRLAESVTPTDYGLFIVISVVAFLVPPIIGSCLNFIGIKKAFAFGSFAGGVCWGLSGLLEFFGLGLNLYLYFMVIIVHNLANAMVVTSALAYTVAEFPNAIAKIFSIIWSAHLLGPFFGGLLYYLGGFFCPHVVMASLMMVLAVVSIALMPPPVYLEDEEACEPSRKGSTFKILCIPAIWLDFAAFTIATICNGFLSVNLEPQVLRQFNLRPVYVAILFGLKDVANSISSPLWGWLCDKNKKPVKHYLVVSSIVVAGSFFFVGAGHIIGIHIRLSMPLLVAALCLNGAGTGGQHVVGVVDALHEINRAGYPSSPSITGLVAGLWCSLSGAGRLISRAGSGVLVDMYGFAAVSSIASGLQVAVAVATLLYLTACCKYCLVTRDKVMRWDMITNVEKGKRREYDTIDDEYKPKRVADINSEQFWPQ